MQQVARELGLGEPLRDTGGGWGRVLLIVGGVLLLLMTGFLVVVRASLVEAALLLAGVAVMLVVVVLFNSVRERRARSKVLLFENGLVIPGHRGKPPVGARWQSIRISRSPGFRGQAYYWLRVPGGGLLCKSDDVALTIRARRLAQRDQALQVILQGGEWEFCGWYISRSGLRLPSGAYRWDQIRFELDEQSRTRAAFAGERSDLLQVRRRGDGAVLDQMQIVDSYLFFALCPPGTEPA